MSSGPHIHSHDSSRRIMLDVIIALLPASVAAVVLFGEDALWLILVCVAAAVLSEYLFNLIAKRKQSVGDLSAVVTGLLLALHLSANVPLWQAALGSVFAIVLVKCVFGGIGRNFANPTSSARVFLLLSFGSLTSGFIAPRGVDAFSGATPLALLAEGKTEELPSLLQMFLGQRAGAIGETCILALLIGFAYLLIRKVISWQTPVIFMGTVFVLSLVFGGFTVAVYELLAGGLVLGAVFMATDYTTTPITASGRMLFALGCGLITFVIRWFFTLPEGVSYSILCMNLMAPWLERWTRRKPLGGV